MRLTKSSDSKIAGVCAGIAEWLDWAPRSIRALFALVTMSSLGFGGIVLYALLAWMMPPPPGTGFSLEDFRVQ